MNYNDVSIDSLIALYDDNCCFPCDGDSQVCEVVYLEDLH